MGEVMTAKWERYGLYEKSGLYILVLQVKRNAFKPKLNAFNHMENLWS